MKSQMHAAQEGKMLLLAPLFSCKTLYPHYSVEAFVAKYTYFSSSSLGHFAKQPFYDTHQSIILPVAGKENRPRFSIHIFSGLKIQFRR
jgi:hypothetical protein